MENIKIRWTYQPKDFFEFEPQLGIGWVVRDGEASLTLNNENYLERYESSAKNAENFLKAWFNASAIIANKTYTLLPPAIEEYSSNGQKQVKVNISGVACIVAAPQIDILIKDEAGNITTDTREERKAKTHKLYQLLSKNYSDPYALKVLKSRLEAIKDVQNEFVHLREITEALKEKYGDYQKAAFNLRLPIPEWRALERIINESEINRSPHRGQSITNREPTNEELSKVRNTIENILIEFLSHSTTN
jgi:hypothetical protein